MTTDDVREFIAGLGIAEDEHCYAYKLTNKKQESIGSYPLKREMAAHIPIGGKKNASYSVFPASFLVHWTKSPAKSEKAAADLFDALMETKDKEVNGIRIKFVKMLVSGPQYVGTDAGEIHEWVIEALIYYERQVTEHGEN